MNIFNSDDDGKFDESDKVRLFQTVEENRRSVSNYAKILAPIALLVLIGLIAAVYFTRTKTGDEAMPPGTMRQQVYDFMLAREKRTPREMTFFQCDGFYWVRILAEPKSYPPSLLLDDVNQFRLSARQYGDDKWEISKLALAPKSDDVPCAQ